MGDRELKKIQPSTGTVVTLLTAPELQPLYPGDWTEDGHVLFATSDGVYRIADTGGEPELIREAREPFFPRMLPDGRTLLHSVGGINSPSVVTLDLETGAIDTVVATGGNAQWSPTGHILHGHPSGTVFAVPYDLERRQATGPGIPARESVLTLGGTSFYRLSPSGSLLYVAGGNTGLDAATSGLAWMDMEGEVTGIRLGPIDHPDIRLSPDGRSIAYTNGGQIHIFDLQLGTNQRFTFEGSEHHDPVWSPDGSRIAFSSDRGGTAAGSG